MPVEFSRSGGITTVVGTAPIVLTEIRETFEAIRATAPAGEAARILIRDQSDSFAPSAGEIRELLRLWSVVFDGLDVRLAVLTPTTVQFGVGRMMEAYAESIGFPSRAFREEQEADAMAWLLEPGASSDRA